MQKKTTITVICLAIAIVGFGTYNFMGDGVFTPPEGYSPPSSTGELTNETVHAGTKTRIKNLDIADSIPKYYKDTLELVAFAEGSGWLKIKTGDGISPTISFDGVDNMDIRKFNQFSERIDIPIRVALSGDTLQVFSNQTATHEDIIASNSDSGSFKKVDFYRPIKTPKLALRKDKDGKIFLVKTDVPVLQPEQAVMAKKE
jgi:hypothetical protein